MPQQSEWNSSSPDVTQVSAQKPVAVPQPVAHPPTERIPRWLVHGELIIRVLLRAYIGITVCLLPWIGSVFHVFNFLWDNNPLFITFPTLAIYAANGAVRGLVSGIGLLNLWIAYREITTAESYKDIANIDRKNR